ncbi:MAG TPA: helix-turn-helix transcriptional regulator [Vicinamibacterales bacterium]|nr:helix-turn-helix transcriptional regulator [Vicinamibacterales bacterium]
MQESPRPVGALLREWRQRRRISQLELALEAEVSPKHVSFVETGRAQPSREMILRFAEQLQVPLRERNVLLNAGGYAPVFRERPLDDRALAAARAAVDLVLRGHEPYPAIAVDRHWTLVASNAAVAPLLEGIDPALLTAPVNVLRLSLHPKGLAPRIVNMVEWRTHVLDRLRRQVEVTADRVLDGLLRELRDYPCVSAPEAGAAGPVRDYAGVVVPLELRTNTGVLAFFSTTTVFGTPLDITLSELAVESFFPADAATAEALRGAAPTQSSADQR